MDEVPVSARRGVSLAQAAAVARRYYLGRQHKSEIAAQLGISRFKVARLIDEAHAAGIVHISIDEPLDLDVSASELIAERFGLRRAIVVRPPESSASALATIGSAAARFLRDQVGPDDVIGMAWGESVAHVVEAVDGGRAAEVVQLVGGLMADPRGPEVIGGRPRSARTLGGGVELIERLASALGADASTLNAPLVLGSAETARALRREPGVARTIERFARVSTAIVGIGSWRPPSSSLVRELSDADQAELRRAGATADVCSIIVNASGTVITGDLTARTMAIGEDALRSVPTVVAVAGGEEKAAAIAAVVRSGLVDVLVTDSAAAARLTG